MKIALGSDHAGYRYKESIKKHLLQKGVEVLDFGTDSPESCDYPDFVRPAAEAVANGEADGGVVLGGSGNGEAIVANKVKGIRCAVVHSDATAAWAKSHNDANVIAIGERTLSEDEALNLVNKLSETIGIDDVCISNQGFGDNVRAINVNMPMKVVCGLKGLNQPFESLDALVGAIFIIMDAPGRGMRDENIEKPTIVNFIPEQGRNQLKHQQPHFEL